MVCRDRAETWPCPGRVSPRIDLRRRPNVVVVRAPPTTGRQLDPARARATSYGGRRPIDSWPRRPTVAPPARASGGAEVAAQLFIRGPRAQLAAPARLPVARRAPPASGGHRRVGAPATGASPGGPSIRRSGLTCWAIVHLARIQTMARRTTQLASQREGSCGRCRVSGSERGLSYL